jgi:hypothetical protein
MKRVLFGIVARDPKLAWARWAAAGAFAAVALVVGIGVGWFAPVQSPGASRSSALTTATPEPLGHSWQQVEVEPAATAEELGAVAGYVGPSRVVLTGQGSGSAAGRRYGPAAWYSDDWVAWHRSRIIEADAAGVDANDLGAILRIGDRLVAFGRAGFSAADGSGSFSVRFESTNGGATWVQMTEGTAPAGGWVTDAAAGGPGYVAVGDTGQSQGPGAGIRVWTSVDGVRWRLAARQDPLLLAGALTAIAAHDGMLMAVGTLAGGAQGGIILTSRDGVAWQSLTAPAGLVLDDVTWAAGAWIVIGEGEAAAIWRSTDDGRSWTVINLPGDFDVVRSVEAAENRIMAVGDMQIEGRIVVVAWTSVDGLHWDSHVLDAGKIGLAEGVFGLVAHDRLLAVGSALRLNGFSLPVAWISPAGQGAAPGSPTSAP